MTGRLPPVFRLLALLLALLLPAGQLADGAGLHHCPDHDAGLGVSLGQVHAHHGASHQAPSHEHQGGCPCLGVGHTSQVAILTSATPVLAVRTSVVIPPRYTEPAPVWPVPSHRLPFAIGPPRTVSSPIA